jgi:hypothetical protein
MNDDDLLSKYGLTPQSNAPKKAVTENDELLSKYGLTGDETEKPAIDENSDWWKSQHDSDYASIAKRFGIGFVRGAKDVLDTGAHGLASSTAYVADRLLPKALADKIRESADATIAADKSGRNEFNSEYPAAEGLIPNATDVGRFTGQAITTAPLMPTSAMAGIGAASNALPTTLATGAQVAAPIANRLVAAAGQGGLGGAIFGGATASTNDKLTIENIGENALGGALAGPALTAGASLAKNVAGKAVNKISPERAELARKAADHGINLEAGQVSTSPTFKKFNQVSGWLPFSGAKGSSEKQIGQFNTAVARTFGEDTPNITPTVLANAKKRIGSNYDTVAANTTIKADNQLINNFSDIYKNAETALDDNQFKTFKKQLELIGSKFRQGNGDMDGEAWQAFRHINSPISRVAGGKDSDLGYYVKALKTAMDGAFNRSAPDDMQSLLRQANGQYKSMKTIEKLANSDAEGQISPLKLMSKVVNSPGGKLKSGELGDLADIGRAFFPVPADSGTPLGEAILGKVGGLASHPISGLGTAAASLVGGAPLLSVAEGGLGLAANAGLRRAINSRAVTNSMLNAADGANFGAIDRAVQKAVPYTGPNLGELQDKRERRSKLPVALEQ